MFYNANYCKGPATKHGLNMGKRDFLLADGPQHRARTEEGQGVRADRHWFSERGLLMSMDYRDLSHNNCSLNWVNSDLSISVKNYSHDI